MCNTIENIKDIINNVIGEVNLALDTDLNEAGLSSLNMMAVISRLEIEFDIEFTDEDMLFDNFTTIQSIYCLIEKLKNQ